MMAASGNVKKKMMEVQFLVLLAFSPQTRDTQQHSSSAKTRMNEWTNECFISNVCE